MKNLIKYSWRHAFMFVFTFFFTWFVFYTDFMQLKTVELFGVKYLWLVLFNTGISHQVGYWIEANQELNDTVQNWKKYARPDIMVTVVFGFLGCITFLICNL
jgi:hypothetical protein